jgi:hypothetical protein
MKYIIIFFLTILYSCNNKKEPFYIQYDGYWMLQNNAKNDLNSNIPKPAFYMLKIDSKNYDSVIVYKSKNISEKSFNLFRYQGFNFQVNGHQTLLVPDFVDSTLVFYDKKTGYVYKFKKTSDENAKKYISTPN